VLAQANTEANAFNVLGLVTENITKNTEGFITTYGVVHDINTTGALQGETWHDSDILYLSPYTAGGLTNQLPPAPYPIITIGYVEYAHSQHGKILVNVQNGLTLKEVNDVTITTPQNGDALTYNALSGIWQNTTLNFVPLSGGTLTGTGTLYVNTLSAVTDVFVNGQSVNSLLTGPRVYTGTGSPEGSVTAARGSIYTDYSTGTVYIKSTINSNTGWI
jgi:hypothetical protein